MFKNLSSLAKSMIFTVIVIALAGLFSQLPGISGEVYMFSPVITVLIMMFIVTRDGYSKSGWVPLGVHKLGLKKWGFAFVAPVVVHLVGYSILWVSGIGEITTANLKGMSPVTMIMATIPMLLIYTVTFSLFEEIGWRGYLLPHLQRLGNIRALVLSGFIHGCWHLPLILLTDVYHAEGSRWVVIPLFLVSLTIVGILIGHVRMATNSVWPAAIIHAVHNVAWARFALLTESDSSYAEILTGDTGIVQLVLYGAVAVLIIRNMKKGTQVVNRKGMIFRNSKTLM
ncbi:type II CAAX endopeptidase family protein [Bacillus sp. FJAT-29814]|uniref:type II CAAX endopeptidase family protein n=1 Tax=Bacillus sp. FJAT-29814 TaxID=1729688 RepID=UPI000836D543|nr:type II CAAX endopeptidase family protein [Bacillus sp. FJAT-29814]